MQYWGWGWGWCVQTVQTVQSVPLSGHNIVISDDSLETTEHLQPAGATNKKHETRSDLTGKTIRGLRQRQLWDCIVLYGTMDY